jgi:O-antigen ligase
LAAGLAFLVFLAPLLTRFDPFVATLVLIGLPAAFVWALKSVEDPFWVALPLCLSAFLGGIFAEVFELTLPITPFQIMFILAIGLWSIHRSITSNRLTLLGIEWPVVALVALACFSMLFSTNVEEGLLRLLRVSLNFVFVFYLVQVLQTKRQLAILLISITILNPEQAAINIQLRGIGVASRAAVTDADPNIFASSLLIGIAFTTALLHSRSMAVWQRVLAVVSLLILISGILSTYSRSSWVAVVILVGFVIWQLKNFRFIWLGFGVSVLALLTIPQVQVLFFSVADRALSLLDISSDASSSIRLLLGQAALEMFADTWGFGVGYRDFSYEFARRYDLYSITYVNEPHNISYQMLAELGLAGFLLFHGIILAMGRMAWQSMQSYKQQIGSWGHILGITLLGTFLAYFVFHQFLPRFLTNAPLMVVLGCMLAYVKIHKLENSQA